VALAKPEIPNPKAQAPNKLQNPNVKAEFAR
jgi:hypothetical protein